MEDFQKESVQYTALPTFQRKGRDLRRHWFPHVYDAQLDQQSRILLPAPLREYAQLETRVTISGCGDWLEIWAPELLEQELERIGDNLEITQESVGEWQR